MSARVWPIWLGVTGTLIVVAAMAFVDTGAFFEGAVSANHTATREPMQQGLRAAFLLISLGAILRLHSPLAVPWRWAVGGALAMLFCSAVGELMAAFAVSGWIADLHTGLGAVDSLERRLFRLGLMAAYAVPMLVLLAAGEVKLGSIEDAGRLSAGVAALLVRWEPLLFTIGATTLASILIAGAFVHRDLIWLSPIGADTTIAGCAAAAIRGRRRADALAFGGWLLVCVSMAIGLLMGSYSFGGPVPTPSLISDYNGLLRALLRDGHVMLMSIGICAIAVAAARQPYKI